MVCLQLNYILGWTVACLVADKLSGLHINESLYTLIVLYYVHSVCSVLERDNRHWFVSQSSGGHKNLHVALECVESAELTQAKTKPRDKAGSLPLVVIRVCVFVTKTEPSYDVQYLFST